MGPAAAHTCRNCGRKTGVPYASMFFFLPPLAGLAALAVWPLPQYWGGVAAAFAGLVILGFGIQRAPLVKR